MPDVLFVLSTGPTTFDSEAFKALRAGRKVLGECEQHMFLATSVGCRTGK